MDRHRQWLRAVYGDRRWIIAADVLAGATSTVDALVAAGAADVVVVAGSRGTGPVPDVPSTLLDVSAPDLMAAIHAFDDAIADPDAGGPPVARLDPDRSVPVVVPQFSQRSQALGRRVWGARRPAWRALEDKTVVDEIWRAAGVPRAPSTIVPASAPALRAAAADLDRGDGTVWVADNRRGWHGGATGLRWVRDDADASAAATFLSERADQVRVMPFLEGIPCSIHGLVLPDVTLTFRPCEMVVLRRRGRSDLLYGGMATAWDPPAGDREALRAAARRVGAHLRGAVGYRGGFSMDGVLTADGFRPTELNPRFSAAMNLFALASGEPLHLTNMAVVEGIGADWDPDALEAHVTAAADAHRQIRSHVMADGTVGEQTVALRRTADGWRTTEDDPDVTVMCGPSPSGTFVRVTPTIDVVGFGNSVADTICDALQWADRHLGLGLGPLDAPRDVRAGA